MYVCPFFRLEHDHLPAIYPLCQDWAALKAVDLEAYEAAESVRGKGPTCSPGANKGDGKGEGEATPRKRDKAEKGKKKTKKLSSGKKKKRKRAEGRTPHKEVRLTAEKVPCRVRASYGLLPIVELCACARV